MAHDRKAPEKKVEECVSEARQLAAEEGEDEDKVVIETLTFELKHTYAALHKITHENKTNVEKKENYKRKIRAYRKSRNKMHPTSSSSSA